MAALACVLPALRAWGAPTLSLELDRDKIYLGESVIANIRLEGSAEGKYQPTFKYTRTA